MKKHLIDTNLYIDFLRAGRFHSFLEELYLKETPGIFLSAVVAQELMAGAISNQGIRNIQVLLSPFERRDRMVTPTYFDWKRAGEILSRLLLARPSIRSKFPALIGDTLIALSAKRIGAVVYTRNRADFELIREYLVFQFESLS